MDCAPNLPTPSGARVNLVIWVDDFSKFVILRATDNLRSETLAQMLEREIIWNFGRPE